MTAALKTYAEHFPWLIPEGNTFSGNDMLTASSRFDINTEKPKTLKEYLQELPNEHNTQQNYSSGTWANSSVIVVARIGDYDNETEGEWEIVAKPKEANENSKGDEKHDSKSKTETISDYFVLNGDIQKYFNDYQDLLYTFKDFVQIGVHPNLQKNISQNNNLDGKEKYFNVTYVMPIPKTKKFFEIKMSNLTKTQYNEINELLQEHLLNKTNSTEKSKGKEQEIMLVDENIMGNHLKSYSHSDPIDSLNIKSNDPPQNRRFMNVSPSSSKPFLESKDYFQPSLTPEGFNYLLNNFDSLYFGLINKSVDPVVLQTTNSPSNRIKNNGFHAEIATDYVKNDESNAEGFFQLTNNNSQDLSNINKVQVGSSRNIVSPQLRRNRTKLFSQLRSKRPIMSAPDNTFHIKVNKLEHPISSTLSPILENNTSEPNANKTKTSLNPVEDVFFQRTKVILPPVMTANKDGKVTYDNTITNTSSQGWTQMYKLLNNSLNKPKPSSSSFDITTETPLNSPDQILKSMNIMEAAALLIDMKKRIEDEDKKKTERYKNYLKQYLGRDEGSLLTKKDDNGNIMKINKQENILEELKLLMIDYFDFMNFSPQEKNNKSSSSTIQPILEATNIFELMEKSSQLVKSNLQIKLQAESKDPTRFVKRIVEKQAEKCKKIFNKDLIKQTQPGSKQYINHRRFKVFTKCMNFKMVRCIVGFSQWLEKGKFYLRPHFKLERAYENYEIERNLYCLRNYNPSSLGSSPHGIRVKPPLKVNRMSGAGKLGARHNNLGLRIRKLKNGKQNGRSRRPNIEINRKYKKQRIAARPIIQRYSDQKGDVTVKRQNGEGKHEIHRP